MAAKIPKPSEPMVDPQTGLVTRSWYLYNQQQDQQAAATAGGLADITLPNGSQSWAHGEHTHGRVRCGAPRENHQRTCTSGEGGSFLASTESARLPLALELVTAKLLARTSIDTLLSSNLHTSFFTDVRGVDNRTAATSSCQ